MDLVFRRISDHDDFSSFICTSKPLTEYLRKYALQNDRMNIARCILVFKEETLVAYYTTSMKDVLKDDFEIKDVRGLPGYPVPVILLGKLAVHTNFEGKGVGKQILKRVFEAAIKSSDSDDVPAFRAIIVDTQEGGPRALNFYLKYGFKPFPSKNGLLYIPLKTVIAAKN